jgi:diguanylate cyclase (GGDEF)-like protein
LTGTGRQSRARPPSRKAPPAGRADFAGRLRPLQAELRRRLARPDILVQVLRTVNATLEAEPVGEALIATVAGWIPAAGWLLLSKDDANEVRVVTTKGIPAALESVAREAGEFVIRSGEVLCSADAAVDRRLARRDGYGSAAAVGFPLVSRGRTVGALVGVDRGPSSREPRFAAKTLAALRGALEPAGLALDNALRMQRAEALTVTDDLTQLYNSRYLSQVLRRETKRASRSGRPLSLVFIDLDGFKAVNDTHGHLAGSSALVEAAAVIRISARETDIVARFGGDEFALILPDTGSDGAAMVGERIKEKIAAHLFLRKDGYDVKLTVSVGVATLPDVAITAEQLVQAADEAMYWVKEHGKNNVRVAQATDAHLKDAKSLMSATWAREEGAR